MFKTSYSRCYSREELQNTNITLANFDNKSILLQTAYAKLSSFNSNNTNVARITFDTGSQKTYVTNDVKTERIFVNEFGNQELLMLFP